MSFAPRLDILPRAQRSLWDELASVPASFVLYGGTAIALRLAHRESVDFDFFSHDPLDHDALEARVTFLPTATTLHLEANTRTVLVRGDEGDVKVSFFGGITFGRVGDPDSTEDGIVRVASLLDLGGTKLKALLQRLEAKDYIDIAALIESGLRLQDILGAAQTLFGPPFNPLVARKALSYFEGGDLATVNMSIRDRLVAAAIEDVESPPLPRRAPRVD